ncbi:MAG TPA: 50S ribosomal protein L11 methyltransferase [Vicinamibacterales bacterium]|nr:50S ribosomal protein L11 methyltransferase [Vicinamibacterales bacterium]
MKLYPALDVDSASEVVLALVDDFSPTAVEEGAATMRLFFAVPDARDAACAELRARGYRTVPLDVSDEDWARRSQDGLEPITIGRITVVPRLPTSDSRSSGADSVAPITIVIEPSMGFGTGHHATTRLCLDALQRADVAGKSVLDVGTGSGVLAIAADRLGAARALGIDYDADAVQSARGNATLNPEAMHTAFALLDLTASPLPDADIVTANLTGALLVTSAAALLAAVRAGGTLILSGILAEERDLVRQAFAAAEIIKERDEAEWLCFVLRKR